MFQPTNESFVRSIVEETRYESATDDDHMPVASRSYQPGRNVVHFLGHLFLGLGQRLDKLGSREIALKRQAHMLDSTAANRLH